MQDGAQLVFVEVRFRKSSRFGSPLATVTHAKQRKLRAAAQFYMQRHNIKQQAVRFDVVGITPSAQDELSDPQINWCQNAF